MRINQAVRVESEVQRRYSSLNLAEGFTPIIDQFTTSEGFDIFAMPLVKWGGEEDDCFLLCLDRLTGWTVRRSYLKLGLKGEKEANLLIEGSCGELGTPAVIPTDQDTRFVSAFLPTMFARLVIIFSFFASSLARC